ncbi:MAG: hypothetical protein WB543_09245 [Candidatus Acidiferrum sp.]
MNLDLSNFLTDEQISVAATQSQGVNYPGPKIERREFESLLERAMEILSARAKSASASRA